MHNGKDLRRVAQCLNGSVPKQVHHLTLGDGIYPKIFGGRVEMDAMGPKWMENDN